LLKRRDILGFGAAAAATGLMTGRGMAQSRLAASGPAADLVVLNAKIITMDPARPRAEAVLVKGGRIALVGTEADVRARGRGVPIFDAGGRAVMPGFIDGHTHIEAFSESMDFQTALPRQPKTIEESLAILRNAGGEGPRGRWIIGRALASFAAEVAEKRMPTLQEMDSISQERPAALFAGPHVVSLNTAALKALKAWTFEEERAMKWRDGTPIMGSFVHRDGNGTPTGVAVEMQELIWQLQPYTPAEREASYSAHARRDYISKGMTSITLISGATERVVAIANAYRDGLIPIRSRRFFLVPQAIGFNDVLKMGLKSGDGNDMLRFGGIKIFADGAGHDGLGDRLDDVKWTVQALSDLITRCDQAGYPTITHIISTGGLKLAIAAHAEAQRRAGTRARPRHRLDHLYFLGDAGDIRRIKELGLSLGLTRASRGDGQVRARPDFRALLDAGVPVQLVSDSAGSFADFSPMAGIASMVAPVSEGGVLPPDRMVTLDEAVKMYTTTAAWIANEEGQKGSISVGKLGDFAVLSADPWTRPGASMFDITVDNVILGGQSVHKRGA